MQIPFRSGLRIGTDITIVRRFLKPVHGQEPKQWRWKEFFQLERRLLRPRESAEMRKRFPWLPKELPGTRAESTYSDELYASLDQTPEHVVWVLRRYFGGRWAAKEAAKKAWGANLIAWRQLEVVTQRFTQGKERDPTEPWMYITVDSTMGEEGGEPPKFVQQGMVSVAHDDLYATATVLTEELYGELREELKHTTLEALKRVREARNEVSNRKLEPAQEAEV
jgi:phosphopantetheinyl transferase (holo-ACP synthase)